MRIDEILFFVDKLHIKKKSKSFFKSFEEFLRNENSKTLSIFTLTTNTILEDYFKDENAVYTGFVSNKWVGFDQEETDNNTFSASRINYYKLNGSTNWARLKDGNIVQIKKIKGKEKEINIYPFSKDLLNIEQIIVEPFFSLLTYFKKLLEEKKYFLIIGYDFDDWRVNNLLFYELNKSPEKLMIIIHPNIDNISNTDYEEKYRIQNVLKEDSKQKVIKWFRSIRRSSFYADFNIANISLTSFEHIKADTLTFIKNFKKYYEFLDEIAKEKQKNTEKF